MKFIPPRLKGFTLPENLYWITVDLKSKNISEEVLKLEINALEEELEKTQKKLSSFKKKKIIKKTNEQIHNVIKENEKSPEKFSVEIVLNDNYDCEEEGEEKKENEKINILLGPEKRKKYQKSKRLCPCCKEIVIRHHCLHNYCDPECPIKLKKNKTK